MALATLLLPSSGSTATKQAGTGDHRTDSRRHDQHHHHGSSSSSSKRKKKQPPPPSPQPSSSTPARTTPPDAGAARSHRVMAASSSSRKSPLNSNRGRPTKKKAAAASSSSSWEQVKSLLSCRSATAAARVHDPSAPSALARLRGGGGGVGTCGASLCSMRDVVVDAASSSAASASAADRDTAPLNRRGRAHRGGGSSSSSAAGNSGSSHQYSSLRGLSGCYECRAINVESMSRRYPRPRELCACPHCGEVFTKADTLEHHQAVRHAVSELGPEDSGRNIVEIIFKSSWRHQKRTAEHHDGATSSICHIDRILKVHNAPRTVARFEAYRDAVRSRCRAVAAARAAADGNELLRFHSAPLACALGLAGATALCCGSDGDASSAAPRPPCCGVCTAIRHGFAPWVAAHPLGVRTTASSGRAHDYCGGGGSSSSVQQQPHQLMTSGGDSNNNGCRAMLVCRVIAGRVRRQSDGAATSPSSSSSPAADEEDRLAEDDGSSFDSVAGEDAASSSVYGNLEELFVANPRAILPCFVVIYRVLDS